MNSSDEEKAVRLCIKLGNTQGACLPINYQEYLTAAVYALLAVGDTNYARFLHDEGYKGEGSKTFKLFTFSGLRAPRRFSEGDRLRLPPGPLEWLISSPIEPFLTNLATGLLATGVLRVAAAAFPILEIQTLHPPALAETVRFTCLTPIVAALPLLDGGTRYLRPSDGAAFSEAVRRNALNKHQRLYGKVLSDDRFALTFDPAYLARDRSGGTKLITYKDIKIVGAFAPFTVTGSPELMRVGYETGWGEKNAAGFGMVEVRNAV